MPVIEGGFGSGVDVAIIGAGAAGLAAARRIMARSAMSVLALEAGSRLGGRACTVSPDCVGVPLDLGCEWLHSALSNAWTSLAEGHGFTVDRKPAPWGKELVFGLSAEERDDYEHTAQDFYRRVADLVASGQDRALGDLIAPGHRWRGLLDAISTYVSGAELDRVSSVDHERYRPGAGADWRVLEGYGRLIATYGETVPVALGAVATAIDHSAADSVRIETNRGRLTARAVVVTVSTDVLASGALRFTPAQPEKLHAAANLPLGLADKLFLQLDGRQDFSDETYRVGSTERAGTGAYHIRPFGRPLIECFYGGALARDLERGGEHAFAAFAGEELAGLFGSGIKARIKPILASAWAREPHILGSYSYARPGAADARAILAAPVDDRLFFAGEACSPQRFTTAHGAYESGVTAADAVLSTFGGAANSKDVSGRRG